MQNERFSPEQIIAKLRQIEVQLAQGKSIALFKSSDYRIRRFELENVLIEHEAVSKAAVVPALDAIRLSVSKAYISLLPEVEPSPGTVLSIFQHTYARLEHWTIKQTLIRWP